MYVLHLSWRVIPQQQQRERQRQPAVKHQGYNPGHGGRQRTGKGQDPPKESSGLDIDNRTSGANHSWPTIVSEKLCVHTTKCTRTITCTALILPTSSRNLKATLTYTFHLPHYTTTWCPITSAKKASRSPPHHIQCIIKDIYMYCSHFTTRHWTP